MSDSPQPRGLFLKGYARPADLEWPDDRTELLPFLPLVYVAWSDGVLTPAERDRIRDRLAREEWLDQESRSLLQAWLNPSAPPSASSLEALRNRIKALGGGLGVEARRSLAALGIDLARNKDQEGGWLDPAAQTLLDLEDALGIVGSEAAKDLLPEAAAPAPTERPRPLANAFASTQLKEFLARPHADLRGEILALLSTPPFRFPHDLGSDAYRWQVDEALSILADRGLGALAHPPAHGGRGDPARAIAAFETLAFGDLSLLVKYGVQFGLFGGSILQLGSERHHARLLSLVGRLELPGCYAMTETGHGSNVRDLETTASYDPVRDEFVVNTPHPGARKDYIGGAASTARLAAVFAQLDVNGEHHGVHALLVPLRDESGVPFPGVSLEDCGLKEGLNGVDNGRIGFSEVRVPRESLLDRFGHVDERGRYSSPIASSGRRFFTMLSTLVAGRISIAAASVSVAKTGLAIAVRYAARRRQFGPAGESELPLLRYRAHQRLLLPKLATTYALHFAMRDLIDGYGGAQDGEGEGTPTSEIEARAAALKAIASEHCVETLQACREACGGQGYLAINRLGRLKADTDVFTTFEGANAVLLQLVAKSLLSEYRDEMGDLRIWDIVRLLADRTQTVLAELNPVVTRRTDEDHLRDPAFHDATFRYREARLLTSAAKRLKALIDSGMDSFEAVNVCQDHLILLARAHADRLTVEAFQEAVAHAPGPATSEVLLLLSQLHALSRVEAGRAWFLESGWLEPVKSRAVRAQVNALCQEIVELAEPLVDAFGIPDPVLEAPIGLTAPV